MFDEIEEILFPDRCEVLKIKASQQFVFPIFKNGSSSLKFVGESFFDQEISNITQPITVFLRDPRERFLSGINTYLQHLKRDHADLDTHTILFFVNQYLFLNRHYLPQFFWLVNLARFMHPDIKLEFKSIDDIATITTINTKAGIIPASQEVLDRIDSFNWSQMELYFFLDQILLDRIGQSCTFQELVTYIKTEHAEFYDLVFKKTREILNVLP
jgi:hypothetical protein